MVTKQKKDKEPKVGLTIYLLKPDMVEKFEKFKEGRQVLSLAEPLDVEFIASPPSVGREPSWVNIVRSALQQPGALSQLTAQSPGGLPLAHWISRGTYADK